MKKRCCNTCLANNVAHLDKSAGQGLCLAIDVDWNENDYVQRLNNQSYSKIRCGQTSQRDVRFCAKRSLCFHGNYYQNIQHNCERKSEGMQSGFHRIHRIYARRDICEIYGKTEFGTTKKWCCVWHVVSLWPRVQWRESALISPLNAICPVWKERKTCYYHYYYLLFYSEQVYCLFECLGGKPTCQQDPGRWMEKFKMLAFILRNHLRPMCAFFNEFKENTGYKLAWKKKLIYRKGLLRA